MQYSRNEVRQHILHKNKFSKFKNLCQAPTSILVQKLFLSSSKPLSWSNLNTYPKKSSQCLPCTFKTFLNITPPPPHPILHSLALGFCVVFVWFVTDLVWYVMDMLIIYLREAFKNSTKWGQL